MSEASGTILGTPVITGDGKFHFNGAKFGSDAVEQSFGALQTRMEATPGLLDHLKSLAAKKYGNLPSSDLEDRAYTALMAAAGEPDALTHPEVNHELTVEVAKVLKQQAPVEFSAVRAGVEQHLPAYIKMLEEQHALAHTLTAVAHEKETVEVGGKHIARVVEGEELANAKRILTENLVTHKATLEKASQIKMTLRAAEEAVEKAGGWVAGTVKQYHGGIGGIHI